MAQRRLHARHVLSSPENYVDPTGNVYDSWADCSTPNASGTYDTSNGATSQGGCWQHNQEKNILEGAGVTWDVLNEAAQNTAGLLAALSGSFGIKFGGQFSWSEVGILTQAIVKTARAFGISAGDVNSGAGVFQAIYDGTSIIRMPGESAPGTGGTGLALPGRILLWGGGITVGGVAHELGHEFDFHGVGYFHTDDQMLGPNGFPSDLIDSNKGYSTQGDYGPSYPGSAIGVERFADMFKAYVVGGFNLATSQGNVRNEFMQDTMYWALRVYHR